LPFQPLRIHRVTGARHTLGAALALAMAAAVLPGVGWAQAGAAPPAAATTGGTVTTNVTTGVTADTKAPVTVADKPEPPPAPCESEDSETITDDPNGGMANESFAAQRVRQRPTPATRIACALRKGRRLGALKIADDFLVDHPHDAQVRFLRAVILGDLSRPAEAATVLESLIEDFPELPEPYNNLAVIRANQGDLGTAEHYLQQAIAAAPNYATARENLGDLYVALAANSYGEALRLGPDNRTVKKKLALARELDGKLHGAP